MKTLRLFCFCLLLLNGLLPAILHSVSYTWLGGTGSWTDTSQWTPTGFPTSGDNALINSGQANISSPISINNLTQNGGTINFTTGSSYLDVIIF